MALGRIHYERNQPSRAIDRYLEVSRKSDLFDETMFEVAWVYVKNKEFDKALRALDVDVIALQEASRAVQRGDVTERLAGALGMYHVFAPATSPLFAALLGIEEGPALLSRFPLGAVEMVPIRRCGELYARGHPVDDHDQRGAVGLTSCQKPKHQPVILSNFLQCPGRACSNPA